MFRKFLCILNALDILSNQLRRTMMVKPHGKCPILDRSIRHATPNPDAEKEMYCRIQENIQPMFQCSPDWLPARPRLRQGRSSGRCTRRLRRIRYGGLAGWGFWQEWLEQMLAFLTAGRIAFARASESGRLALVYHGLEKQKVSQWLCH
jgi:hypothetical protein